MAYFAQQKLLYYKRYKLDIWGLLRNTLLPKEDKTSYTGKKLFIDIKVNTRLIKQERHRLIFLKKNADYYLNEYKKNKISKSKWRFRSKKHLDFKWSFLRRCITLFLDKSLYKGVFKIGISIKLTKIFLLLTAKHKTMKKLYYKRPFIYEGRVSSERQRVYRASYQNISLRVIKLFYISYTYKQLRNVIKKSKSKNGVFEQNFLYFIECKLPSYIYRTSFFSNMFESISFVKFGHVLINKKYKPLLYYSVKLYDIVCFNPLYKGFIYWNFIKRIRRKAFMFLFSRCMYVSLPFLFTIFIHFFSRKDIINAFKVDYYRLAEFAQ